MSGTTGWAVGYNGTAALILSTITGGNSRTPQASTATEALNDVFFVDDQRGWAVGDGGRIVHGARRAVGARAIPTTRNRRLAIEAGRRFRYDAAGAFTSFRGRAIVPSWPPCAAFVVSDHARRGLARA